MSHLLRLSLALFLLHVVLIVTAHLITRDQHPAFLDLFTNPDGTPCDQPCLFGVRPGKMSLEEAARVLQKHWLVGDLRIIPTENDEYPLVADAKGVYSGKRFRIWLVPGPANQNPRMADGIELGILEYDQGIASDFKVPITSSGTFMTFFGSPAGWYLNTTDSVIKD